MNLNKAINFENDIKSRNKTTIDFKTENTNKYNSTKTETNINKTNISNTIESTKSYLSNFFNKCQKEQFKTIKLNKILTIKRNKTIKQPSEYTTIKDNTKSLMFGNTGKLIFFDKKQNFLDINDNTSNKITRPNKQKTNKNNSVTELQRIIAMSNITRAKVESKLKNLKSCK